MKTKFVLPRLRVRIAARVCDFILSSVPCLIAMLILNFTVGWKRTWITLLVAGGHLLWLIGYFIVIPILWRGATPGKQMLKIRLVSVTANRKAFVLGLIARELLIVFLPLMWNLGMGLGLQLGLKITRLSTIAHQPPLTQILLKMQPTFLLLWYLSILLYAKISEHHQVFLDKRCHLLVVRRQIKLPLPRVTHASERGGLIVAPGVVEEQALRQIASPITPSTTNET